MNIGIIIYSHTGHTREVAESLKEKLEASGHTATITEIIPAGEVRPGPGSVVLKQTPDASLFDAVIFGAPIMAFSLNPAVKAYLPGLSDLTGKKTALFFTKHLHSKWTGGNGSIRIMKNAVESRGGTVAGSEIIFWSAKDREKMIRGAVEHLAGLF